MNIKWKNCGNEWHGTLELVDDLFYEVMIQKYHDGYTVDIYANDSESLEDKSKISSFKLAKKISKDMIKSHIKKLQKRLAGLV